MQPHTTCSGTKRRSVNVSGGVRNCGFWLALSPVSDRPTPGGTERNDWCRLECLWGSVCSTDTLGSRRKGADRAESASLLSEGRQCEGGSNRQNQPVYPAAACGRVPVCAWGISLVTQALYANSKFSGGKKGNVQQADVRPEDIFTQRHVLLLLLQSAFTELQRSRPQLSQVVSLHSRRPHLARLPTPKQCTWASSVCCTDSHSSRSRSTHMWASLCRLPGLPKLSGCRACYCTPATILLPCKQAAHDHTLAYLRKKQCLHCCWVCQR